jgi:hypothetical protein
LSCTLPPTPALANFPIMRECTPAIGRCHSVYSVVARSIFCSKHLYSLCCTLCPVYSASLKIPINLHRHLNIAACFSCFYNNGEKIWLRACAFQIVYVNCKFNFISIPFYIFYELIMFTFSSDLETFAFSIVLSFFNPKRKLKALNRDVKISRDRDMTIRTRC